MNHKNIMVDQSDSLELGDRAFNSRLFIGTGKFSSGEALGEVVRASGTQMVTVAMKRANPSGGHDSILSYLKDQDIQILPNTSGVRNAKEAVFVAQMAREALQTNWLKLEIHPDPKYLMPCGRDFACHQRVGEGRIHGFALLPC